jgi:hypothetical protein
MGPNYYVEPQRQSFIPQGKMLYLIIGAIAALIVGGILIAVTNGSKKDLSLQYAQIESQAGQLNSLVNATEITRNIRNETLNNIVVESSTNITSDINAFHSAIQGVNMPQQVTLNDEVKQRLEDASLKNQLDSAYREEFMKQIELVRAQLSGTYPQVKLKAVLTAMESMDGHLSEIYKRLEELNL